MKFRIMIAIAICSIASVSCVLTGIYIHKTNTIKKTTISMDSNNKFFILITDNEIENFQKDTVLTARSNNEDFEITIQKHEKINDSEYNKVFIMSESDLTDKTLEFYFEGKSWGEYIFHKVI